MRLLNRIKAGLATTEAKLKVIVVFFGSLITIALLCYGTFSAISSPKYCQLCHEMKPEYVTWQAGVHTKASCLDCHVERKEPVYAVKAALKESYVHFTGQVLLPIQVDKSFDSKVCESCHSENRVVTPPGDIKIPHATHKQNGVACVQCHNAIAHANVAKDGFTLRRSPDKWNAQVGRAYMRDDFIRLKMNDCLECHTSLGMGPTKQCDACHTKFVKPPSHQESGFINQHGVQAFKDISQCDKCHKTTETNKDLRQAIDDPVTLYVRRNTFCSSCHTTNKPASHTTDWRLAHRTPASQNRQYCTVCHDETTPTKDSVATTTGCGNCHKTNLHSMDFANHKNLPLPAKPTITKECQRCHGESCRNCHYLSWPPATTTTADSAQQ